MMIRKIEDLFRVFGVEGMAVLKKEIFKTTECGAWIREVDGGVVIGSIVEGSDAEVGPVTLPYPFPVEDFWEKLQDVDNEACRLWEEVNEDWDD